MMKHRNFFNISIFLTIALLNFCVLSTGCRSLGGKRVEVVFTSNPPGANVYLIKRFQFYGDGTLMDNQEKLENLSDKAVLGTTMRTPFPARVSAGRQVAVFVKDGRKASMEIYPKKDGESIHMDLTSIPLPSGNILD